MLLLHCQTSHVFPYCSQEPPADNEEEDDDDDDDDDDDEGEEEKEEKEEAEAAAPPAAASPCTTSDSQKCRSCDYKFTKEEEKKANTEITRAVGIAATCCNAT